MNKMFLHFKSLFRILKRSIILNRTYLPSILFKWNTMPFIRRGLKVESYYLIVIAIKWTCNAFHSEGIRRNLLSFGTGRYEERRSPLTSLPFKRPFPFCAPGRGRESFSRPMRVLALEVDPRLTVKTLDPRRRGLRLIFSSSVPFCFSETRRDESLLRLDCFS